MERIYIVHPQVALQIADHTTRSNFFAKDFISKYKYVIGILYGFCDERKIEICSTCEAIVSKEGDSYVVDKTAYECITRHHNLNYVGEIELGWYNITPMDAEEINAVNAAFEKLFKVQIRVTYQKSDGHALVLNVPSNGGQWKEVIYKYRSELAEHVAISQIQSQGDAIKQISFTAEAYSALDNELAIIQDFLKKTMEGQIPFHPDLVRKCANIALWFIHSRPDEQSNIAIEEGQLSLLAGILAEAMTKIEPTLPPVKKSDNSKNSTHRF